MKAVFAIFYAETPHLETELELIVDLLAQGHEVHVLRCTGQLVSCMGNPKHRESGCLRCISKIDRALEGIASPRLTVEVIAPAQHDPRLPTQFGDINALKRYELDGINLGRAASSSVCASINKDAGVDTVRHATEVRLQLEAAFESFSAVHAVLSRVKPDRVYVFNGRFATVYPVVLAARALGIDYFTHDRGATAAHYLLRRNHLPHDLDISHEEMIALWEAAGPDRAEQAAAWYQRRRDGSEEAWLSFTKSQEVGLLPPGFDSMLHNVVVFNSTMEEYSSIAGRPDLVYEDEVEGFRQIAESLGARPDVHLYLRIHPHLKGIPRNDHYQLRAYAAVAEQVPNLTVIWPESVIHTYALMERCNTVLTFGSTMGAESAFWGKPSVLAGRGFYEGVGCCYVPTTHAEVVELLCRPDLTPRPGDGALVYGYWEANRGARYRHFSPTGLFTGRFEGETLDASVAVRVRAALLARLGR